MLETEEATPDDARTRVAILGAGPAGLAAAAGLTDTPALREKYDVTVYQVGWRAGGKITSGRQGAEKRIEQNGTHYLFGSYDNSFRLMKRAYDELEAAGVTSFGTWREALLPLDVIALKQFYRGSWHDWVVEIPTNRRAPGDTSPLGVVDYLTIALQWMIEMIGGWKLARAIRPRSRYPRPEWWDRLVGPVERGLGDALDQGALGLLRLAVALARRIAWSASRERDLEDAVAWLLAETRDVLWAVLGPRVETDLASCRQWMLVDLGCSLLIGLIEDRALAPGGMAAIDRYDFREWLRRHGAREETLYSPLVTGWYDSIASYEDGDRSRPNVAAGVSVSAILHATLGYKGSVVYQAARELGDSFVAPIFEMLRRRGVRFRFFSRVWEVEPEGDSIKRIHIEQQVELKSGDPYDYEPFIHARGLKAWPDRSRETQIVDGHALRGVDLEDFYTKWRGSRYTLEKDRDFDQVVFAMPVDTIPFYCPKLVAEHDSWKRMVEHIRGVDTRSIWLYFRPTLRELGWTAPKPVLTGYVPPFSTWEETTYLVATEEWPAGQQPGMIASLFGPLPGPAAAPGPDDPGDYPEAQKRESLRSAYTFATRDVGALWPRATSPENPVGVDWDLLIDLKNREGAERFRFQGVRANYGPIQRYTLARKGTLRYRLRADESSYRNLFLAGDWTRNGGDVGCVEGAVAGGLYAAIAICGEGNVVRMFPDNGL